MSCYFIWCPLLSSPYLHFIFLPLYQSPPVKEHMLSFSYNTPTHYLRLPIRNTAPTSLLYVPGLLHYPYQSIFSPSWILLLPCRYVQQIPPKHSCISIKLHEITSKKDDLLQKILKTSFSNKDRTCSSYRVAKFLKYIISVPNCNINPYPANVDKMASSYQR